MDTTVDPYGTIIDDLSYACQGVLTPEEVTASVRSATRCSSRDLPD